MKKLVLILDFQNLIYPNSFSDKDDQQKQNIVSLLKTPNKQDKSQPFHSLPLSKIIRKTGVTFHVSKSFPDSISSHQSLIQERGLHLIK